jgi:hypothetical protein
MTSVFADADAGIGTATTDTANMAATATFFSRPLSHVNKLHDATLIYLFGDVQPQIVLAFRV